MTDTEPPSLEYIEDPYFQKLPQTATPSLDEITEFDQRHDGYDPDIEWSAETEFYLRSMPLEHIFCIADDHDMQTVEAELIGEQIPNGLQKKQSKRDLVRQWFTKKSMRDVKVTFIDFSKPYLAKISSSDNYKNYLNIGNHNDDGNTSPHSVASAEIASEFAALSVEEQENLRAEWSQDLARVEEEITTLRTVLNSKIRHANELKRKLGITVWKEISDDVNQGLKNVKESKVYQTTESALKTTAEKTSSIFGGITSGISSKLTQMKKSDSYRSLEERVGSAYENVKTKVSTTTSRSGSISSINDTHTTPSTPTIPEEKPIA